MLKRQKLVLSLGFAALLISSSSMAQTSRWRFTTGSDFNSGDYGSDPVATEITYVPFTTSYRSGLWTLKATVPWVEIDGAGTVVGAGDGRVVNGNSRRNQDSEELEATTESGLGDIWLSAAYAIEAIPADLFYLDLGAKLKLPTADEDRGLGSGKTDYTLQADLFKPIGNATPFITLAYKMKDYPADAEINDVMFVSAGSDFSISSNTHVGLSVDYQESAFSDSDDSLELFGYINQKLSNDWSLMFYGYSGLDDGSPDYGVGFQVSYNP